MPVTNKNNVTKLEGQHLEMMAITVSVSLLAFHTIRCDIYIDEDSRNTMTCKLLLSVLSVPETDNGQMNI